MSNQKDRIFGQLKILSLDGSEIYIKMHPLSGPAGLSVKNSKDEIDSSKLRGYLDESLDTAYLSGIYYKYKEQLLTKSFRFSKDCTLALVNVSFEYAINEFAKRGNKYIRNGYEDRIDWDNFQDHIYAIEENGVSKLIAIEVPKTTKTGKEDKKYKPVENPQTDLLGDYFFYDEEKQQYLPSKLTNSVAKFETLVKKDAIRNDLYENGFYVDGVHYVRYKRSAGSSRDGQCLFIAEPLYEPMMNWSSCGINGNTIKDQASWQAYISLTLSSITDRIYIPKKSILIIKDQYSIFTDNAVKVFSDGDSMKADFCSVEIENKIWDGEALLDVSVFNENGYSENGMLLLRNRFFKTCAFNTNLQKWFEDNGIKHLNQLNGHYYKDAPRDIKDIKLVITESSLKYLKFFSEDEMENGFDRWIESIFDADDGKEYKMFGVVKFDKDSGPMENCMAYTNYQLLNTLELTYSDTLKLTEPSLEFFRNIQRDPAYLRRYTNLHIVESEIDDFYQIDHVTADNYRQHLINNMMRLSDDFEFTKFYKDYRHDICKSFKDHLKNGRMHTEGNYQTILGNGIEFLHAVIDKSYVVDFPIALSDGEIYTERFADGENLLCARSPHITMGNLLVARNVHSPELKKYFNLGSAQAVVCVNAIRSNLQQRLNGCDYDSDTMLVTNHPILWDVANKNHLEFGVPVCNIKPKESRTYSTAAKDLADLDKSIAENCIGEIVNLSQFLNSLYWDGLSKGRTRLDLKGLYEDICKLAVLSGMEIDKAKRSYSIKSRKILSQLQNKYKKTFLNKNNKCLPEFFAFITENEKVETSTDAKLNTAMSHIFDIVNTHFKKAPKTNTVKYRNLFDLNPLNDNGNDTHAKNKILDIVSIAQQELKTLTYEYKNKSKSEKQYAKKRSNEIFNKCLDDVGKKLSSASDHLYHLLLQELDKEEPQNKVSNYHALLFSVLCYANNGALIKRLKKPQRIRYELIWAESNHGKLSDFLEEEIIYIFNHPHILGRTLRDGTIIPKSQL